MLVSNGSGQGSEYRVGTNSGGSQLLVNRSSAQMNVEYVGGSLKPGESESCSICEAVYVEFLVDGEVVTSAWFSQDPGQVMLVEKGGRYTIEVTSEITGVAA